MRENRDKNVPGGLKSDFPFTRNIYKNKCPTNLEQHPLAAQCHQTVQGRTTENRRPPRPSSSAIGEACQEVVEVAERPCACSPCRRRARSSVKVSTWTEAAPTETGRFCKCDRADAVDGKTCARSDLLSLVPVHRSVHSSESQQEFFRMLDEKIEKVRNDKPPHTNKRKRLRLDGGTVDNPFIAANLCMWGHKGLNLCDA